MGRVLRVDGDRAVWVADSVQIKSFWKEWNLVGCRKSKIIIHTRYSMLSHHG